MNDKLIDITIRVGRDTPVSELLSLPDWVEEIVVGGREIENGDYYEGLEEGIKIGKGGQGSANHNTDWIPHTGDECPVHPLDVVEVRDYMGTVFYTGPAGENGLDWSYTHSIEDIDKYRHVCDPDGIPYVYDKGDLPEWAEYVATTAEGVAFALTGDVSPTNDGFWRNSGLCETAPGKYDNTLVDWKDSLRRVYRN